MTKYFFQFETYFKIKQKRSFNGITKLTLSSDSDKENQKFGF